MFLLIFECFFKIVTYAVEQNQEWNPKATFSIEISIASDDIAENDDDDDDDDDDAYLIFVIFLHRQNFCMKKFTPKNA